MNFEHTSIGGAVLVDLNRHVDERGFAHVLSQAERRLTYRFHFAPGTIGAITRLARNEDALDRIRAGLVLACVGDPGPVVYKRSRQGDTVVDRVAAHVLRSWARSGEVIDFSPYGNDERQFCSPGFNLPVGAITPSGHDRNLHHHTSADDLASIDPEALAGILGVCLAILGILDDDATLVSLNPKREPQLGRRGLYRSFGGRRAGRARIRLVVGDEPGRRRAHDPGRGRAVWACRSGSSTRPPVRLRRRSCCGGEVSSRVTRSIQR